MANNMADAVISSGDLTLKVNAHGAEMSSIQYKGEEYLWNADPKHWNRHSPVLFPIIGALWNDTYRLDGKEIVLAHHGFARDSDFTLAQKTDNEVWYRFANTEETMKKYPWEFELNFGYKVEGNKIIVTWKVTNKSNKEMLFQMGGHPAFYYKGEKKNGVKGYFKLDNTKDLAVTLLGEQNCADESQLYEAPLNEEGLIAIKDETFDKGPLIFDKYQVKEVTILDADKKPYVKATFETPLVGLWAPSAESPFVCIEPWYGRCDAVGYKGEFKDKVSMQHLAAGDTFTGVYTIELM